MPRRYIWWDDKRSDPPKRMQLRPPTSLHDFASEVAEIHGVSVNAFVVALLDWAFTQQQQHGLRIDVRASRVTVTPGSTPDSTPQMLSDFTTADESKPYKNKGKR